ncbi:MAG: DUF2914 domain-containing protein [Reinekea sp.]
MKKLLAIALLFVAGFTLAEGEVEVARHQFTSAIEQREPVDELTDAKNVNPLYFFTDLRNFEGTVVTHRWSYNGNVMAEVNFNVGGPRWRVYSSKKLQPEWDGVWKVEVLDETGSFVSIDTINISID